MSEYERLLEELTLCLNSILKDKQESTKTWDVKEGGFQKEEQGDKRTKGTGTLTRIYCQGNNMGGRSTDYKPPNSSPCITRAATFANGPRKVFGWEDYGI